jgi:hypothetical protein
MMFESFNNKMLHLFSGKDNTTLDIGRILWAISVVTFLLLSAYSIHNGQLFDPIAWGTGIGLVLGAGGAAIAIKSTTEPDTKCLPPTESNK